MQRVMRPRHYLSTIVGREVQHRLSTSRVNLLPGNTAKANGLEP